MRYYEVLVVLALISSSQTAVAQPPEILWSHNYDNGADEYCMTIQATYDGGYVMAGRRHVMSVGYGIWLVKTDSVGDTVWTRMVGHPSGGDEYCYTIIQTSDLGYALAAQSEWTGGSGYHDFMLMKTNEAGNFIWSNFYGGIYGEIPYTLLETEDGGFMLGGYTDSPPHHSNYWDMWVVRTDANGDSLWSRRFGFIYGSECTSILPTSDGKYLLPGRTGGYEPDSTFGILLKMDANGDSLWGYRYRHLVYNSLSYVYETTDGGFLASGTTDDGTTDCFWLVKIDSAGHVLWDRTYPMGYTSYYQSAHETPDGGLIIVGYGSCIPGATRSSMVWKADESGNLIWCMQTETGNNITVSCIDQAADGSYIIGGSSRGTGSQGSNYWLMKLAPEAPPSASSVPDITTNSFALSQNYPNPFNLSTTISFTLPHMSDIKLTVYDITGREVQRLMNGLCKPGDHAIEINGRALTSGIYFVRLQSEYRMQIRKIVLLK